ncbi:AcvB/VirJ family lysyl-phosphatidylglycerol hydrolase [Dokdonella ginsengisoli]|uniref:AcvB/VirJ family lysyl-phosphatidylglycerol hydrolase n=1 Tax=Dokdonella ginsengisoli TaxID=363846 RepID=A0ABV9QW68_9GAMM
MSRRGRIVAALLALALVPGLRAEGRGLDGALAAAEGNSGPAGTAPAIQPSALSPQPSTLSPQPSTLDYGLFGPLHLSRPPGAIAHTALLVSDRDGWSARQDGLADALARQGVLVVGIDLPAYLKRMQAIASDKCSYPSAHFEEVAHWIERHEGLSEYAVPLVVGDGTGATFAYAMTAQAPAGTFEGLITLGWDASLRFSKVLCAGDAGAMTVADGDGFRVEPVAKFPLPWRPQPFARGARVDGIGTALASAWRFVGQLWPVLAEPAAQAGLARAYARMQAGAASGALPDDVADLPLIEIEPTAPAAGPVDVAVMLTGDGGWAGLDRGVADALAAKGMRVVGFSTLKFFWQKRTPEATAQALARVIAHYGKSDAQARFLLIGYSFGASLVPVVLNRLPDELRRRVRGGAMISPDDEAVFEIHVGDWFGSTHHDEALPIAPEIAASKVPLLCVHGADEDDSPCRKAQPAMRAASLPGGHHYDGDYDALGALLVRELSAASP